MSGPPQGTEFDDLPARSSFASLGRKRPSNIKPGDGSDGWSPADVYYPPFPPVEGLIVGVYFDQESDFYSGRNCIGTTLPCGTIVIAP